MTVNKQELIKACVDSIKNPTQVANFSNGADVDAKIRAQFHKIMGTDKPTRKHIRKHGTEIFEILEEVLTETYLKGVQEDEFFMQFAEIRNLALGDSQEFYIEDDAVLYVSEHAGTHWNISRQKLEGGDSFTIKTKYFAAAVYGDFQMFATGRLSFGRLVAKVAEAIQNKVYEEVAASFAVGSAQLPTEFRQQGSYTEAQLIKIYQHVGAATGSQPIVLGTQAALAKVTAGQDAQWASNEMKNELNNTGRFGKFKGMTLVQLPQVHKVNTFEFAYDDDQLLILPTNTDRFIKIVFEGDDMIKEVTDPNVNNDMSVEHKFITNFGVNTVFSSVFGIYTLA